MKLLKKQEGIIFFLCDVEGQIKQARMIFISVNTPTREKGIGAGQASNLKYVDSCSRKVAKDTVFHNAVIEKSTLTVRTMEVIQNILEAAQINSEVIIENQNLMYFPFQNF